MNIARTLIEAGGTSDSKALGDNVYVWLAILLASFTIGKQIYDAFKNRRKTRDEIEDALDKQPFIREQLEIGNFGEAIKQLNVIINSQAEHITRQDGRIEHLEEENEELREKDNRNSGLIDKLTTHVDNLESEIIRLRRQLGEMGPQQ